MTKSITTLGVGGALILNEELRKARAERDQYLAQRSALDLEAAKLRSVLFFVWDRITTNEEGVERGERGWHATFEYEELDRLIAHKIEGSELVKEFERLQGENSALREWIRSEGIRTNICTFDVLHARCEDCRCGREI